MKARFKRRSVVFRWNDVNWRRLYHAVDIDPCWSGTNARRRLRAVFLNRWGACHWWDYTVGFVQSQSRTHEPVVQGGRKVPVHLCTHNPSGGVHDLCYMLLAVTSNTFCSRKHIHCHPHSNPYPTWPLPRAHDHHFQRLTVTSAVRSLSLLSNLTSYFRHVHRHFSRTLYKSVFQITIRKCKD